MAEGLLFLRIGGYRLGYNIACEAFKEKASRLKCVHKGLTSYIEKTKL